MTTKTRNIREYLPNKKKQDKQIVQGLVSKDLAQEVKAILTKEKLSWNKLLTACLMKYRDEMKGK